MFLKEFREFSLLSNFVVFFLFPFIKSFFKEDI